MMYKIYSGNGKDSCPMFKPQYQSHWRFSIGIAFIMLIFSAMPAISESPYDFAGTVLRVSQPNEMVVNITESRIAGPGDITEVLIDQPLPGLLYFEGKALQFDSVGHDILGRPIVTGYLNGRRIQDVYYCIEFPNICAHFGPNFRNELIGTEAYNLPEVNIDPYRYPYGYYGYYGCAYCL